MTTLRLGCGCDLEVIDKFTKKLTVSSICTVHQDRKSKETPTTDATDNNV